MIRSIACIATVMGATNDCLQDQKAIGLSNEAMEMYQKILGFCDLIPPNSGTEHFGSCQGKIRFGKDGYRPVKNLCKDGYEPSPSLEMEKFNEANHEDLDERKLTCNQEGKLVVTNGNFEKELETAPCVEAHPRRCTESYLWYQMRMTTKKKYPHGNVPVNEKIKAACTIGSTRGIAFKLICSKDKIVVKMNKAFLNDKVTKMASQNKGLVKKWRQANDTFCQTWGLVVDKNVSNAQQDKNYVDWDTRNRMANLYENKLIMEERQRLSEKKLTLDE